MKKGLKFIQGLDQRKLRWLLLLFLNLTGRYSFGQMPTYADSSSARSFDTSMSLNQSDLISPASVTVSDWNLLGRVYEDSTPYNLYYYKLLQVNANTHRYESIIEVSVQGDENYYQMQGTYRIRIDKYEGTSNRFDGLEIQCFSGNPNAATFYVYNNAVWIRSNYNWGEIYYRTVADFSYYTPHSPLAGPTFVKTTTAPTGYLTATSTYGVKCDFDHNAVDRLPYTDVKGNMFVNGNVGIGTTSPQSKLAVNGTVTAKQVTVTQNGWPDYVFEKGYSLPSLDSVRTFISRNGHLPGMSSATDMEKNGNNLGDTDAHLLQKVEELTLYVIDMDKRILQLQEENNFLKQQLDAIKTTQR